MKYLLTHYLVIILVGILLIYGYSLVNGVGIDLYKCYANNLLYGSSFVIENAQNDRDVECLLNIRNDDDSFGKLPAEYPLLSLVPMLIAAITGNTLFNATFIFLMLSFVFGIYLILFKTSVKAALAYILYMLLGGFSIAIARFDALVGFLIILSLLLASQKKYFQSYFFLALATMMKFIPALLLIPIFLSEKKHNPKGDLKKFYGIFIFLFVCISVLAFSLLIDSKIAFSPLTYNTIRPLQIESVPASIMFLFSSVNIIDICFGSGFGSFNVYGVMSGVCNASNYTIYNLLFQMLTVTSLTLFILGFGYLTRLFMSNKLTLIQFSLSILLVFLSTNKVFSPQYLFWIYPLIAYLYGFDKRWLILTSLIALLTTIIYPFLYGDTILPIPYNHLLLLVVILIRNTLLVSLTIFYVFNLSNLRTTNIKYQH